MLSFGFRIFCWYRGFCHRTGSDLLLFLLMSHYSKCMVIKGKREVPICGTPAAADIPVSGDMPVRDLFIVGDVPSTMASTFFGIHIQILPDKYPRG